MNVILYVKYLYGKVYIHTPHIISWNYACEPLVK